LSPIRKKNEVFCRVRDLEGAVGGANRNERCDDFWFNDINMLKRSAVKHGSEADPGKSPTAWEDFVGREGRNAQKKRQKTKDKRRMNNE